MIGSSNACVPKYITWPTSQVKLVLDVITEKINQLKPGGIYTKLQIQVQL